MRSLLRKGTQPNQLSRIEEEAWEEDPNSYYGRQWAAIQAAQEEAKGLWLLRHGRSHPRRLCRNEAKHKSQFQFELSLWRRAVLKWAKDTGFGIGALVRSPYEFLSKGWTIHVSWG